ncbi:MAG: response regulator [Proteobacteria bacterium]|nr:response regulator [Pseudomonadota bacterium]
MSKRILVVDDDELVLAALVELLSPRGYDVTTASNGPGALETLRRDVFDLLILDIVMPQMDGYQLCQKIRTMKGYATIPIIMLTAKSGEEDQKRGLKSGADLFLPKPIAPQRLLDLVDAAFDKEPSGGRN